jgi:hypothetical protein
MEWAVTAIRLSLNWSESVLLVAMSNSRKAATSKSAMPENARSSSKLPANQSRDCPPVCLSNHSVGGRNIRHARFRLGSACICLAVIAASPHPRLVYVASIRTRALHCSRFRASLLLHSPCDHLVQVLGNTRRTASSTGPGHSLVLAPRLLFTDHITPPRTATVRSQLFPMTSPSPTT